MVEDMVEDKDASSEHMGIANDTLSRRRFLDGESKADEQLTDRQPGEEVGGEGGINDRMRARFHVSLWIGCIFRSLVLF